MASTAKTANGPIPVEDDNLKLKNQPNKTLPCERVTFARQLEILRGYAAASAQGSKAVRNADVGDSGGK